MLHRAAVAAVAVRASASSICTLSHKTHETCPSPVADPVITNVPKDLSGSPGWRGVHFRPLCLPSWGTRTHTRTDAVTPSAVVCFVAVDILGSVFQRGLSTTVLRGWEPGISRARSPKLVASDAAKK